MFPLLTILASQFIAPAMWFDWPNFAKLTVLEITHEDAEWYTPPPSDEDFIKLCGLTAEECEPYRIPARTIISVQSKHGHNDITIDEEAGEIITLGVRRPKIGPGGSADIGIMLFGIPGLIATSPLIAANHLVWSIWETMTGMERHVWSVWIRIKDQLDPLSYIIAEKAFQKYKGKDYGR